MEKDRIYIENGDVIISGTNIWMTYGEIAELFNVTVGVVTCSVRQVLREGVLKEYEVCRYIELGNGCYADVMGMDLIMALAFKFDTFHAYLIRKWMAERCCFSCGKPSYYTVCICIGGHFRVLL